MDNPRFGGVFRSGSRVVSVLGLTLALAILGCSGAATPVPPAKYNPEEMAAAAMADYDTNHDGKLDAAELENCPA